MPSDLERSVFQTVCWFSIFDYPLTVFELWKWMWMPARTYALADVYGVLSGSAWLQDRLAEHDGHFALARGPAVAELVRGRREKHVDAVRKYAKLKRALSWFARIPGIEGVAAVNTLAWFHTRPESDIDLFIIVRPGAIWSTRLLAVAPFILFGRRPHDVRPVIDPFCFSFFATKDALNLEPLCLNASDPYLAYWTRSIMPMFDRSGVFEKFWEENQWANDLLPDFHLRSPTTPNPRPTECVRSFGRASSGRRGGLREDEKRASSPFQGEGRRGYYGGILERLARRIQMRRLPARIRELANQDSRVVIGDQMLKFHDNDRREEYRRRFEWTQGFYGS